jgi:hypothetical protein
MVSPIRQQPSNADMRFRDQESAGTSLADLFLEILNGIMKLRDFMRTKRDLCSMQTIVGVCKASEESSTYTPVELRVQKKCK